MSNRKWNDYDAVAACEGFDGEEHDEDTLLSAWQHLINTGLCWRLQGWFGRQAKALIDAGHCYIPEGGGKAYVDRNVPIAETEPQGNA